MSSKSAATTEPKQKRSPKNKLESKQLPPWNVILQNDNNISFDHVVDSIMKVLKWAKEESEAKAKEAHNNDKAVLITTHFEFAELVKEQFNSCLPAIPTFLQKAN